MPTAHPATEPWQGWLVALGASAGGPAALQRFFAAVPDGCNVAFCVVQHIAAGGQASLLSLLASHTRMPVQLAEEGTALCGGHVVVLPPGGDWLLQAGRLVRAGQAQGEMGKPIDAFFTSLARDRAARCVGMVLSGAGSDGTAGALALQAAGARVYAQAPETALFDAMPRSAMASGCVQAALPPEGLAAELMRVLQEPELARDWTRRGSASASATSLDPPSVAALLAQHLRLDITQYKLETPLRCVAQRMKARGCGSLDAYAAVLAQSCTEVDQLRRDVLVPVTQFYRDPEHMQALREQALLPMVLERAKSLQPEPIRVWVAASSTGEEAYTVAMLLLDLIAQHCPGVALKVFATDVELAYLNQGAKGYYSAGELAALPEGLRDRWFVPLDATQQAWKAGTPLRQCVVFFHHDLFQGVPFARLDMVSCRNALIYLQPQAQQLLLNRFAFALKRGGILFLGHSESLLQAGVRFEALDARHRVFRRPQTDARQWPVFWAPPHEQAPPSEPQQVPSQPAVVQPGAAAEVVQARRGFGVQPCMSP